MIMVQREKSLLNTESSKQTEEALLRKISKNCSENYGENFSFGKVKKATKDI